MVDQLNFKIENRNRWLPAVIRKEGSATVYVVTEEDEYETRFGDGSFEHFQGAYWTQEEANKHKAKLDDTEVTRGSGETGYSYAVIPVKLVGRKNSKLPPNSSSSSTNTTVANSETADAGADSELPADEPQSRFSIIIDPECKAKLPSHDRTITVEAILKSLGPRPAEFDQKRTFENKETMEKSVDRLYKGSGSR